MLGHPASKFSLDKTLHTERTVTLNLRYERFDANILITNVKHDESSAVDAFDEPGITASGVRGSCKAGLVQWREKAARILY